MEEFWYIAIIRDTRVIPVVGPLPSRERADAVSARAKRLAYEIDAFTWFDRWATIRTASGNHRGVLDDRLGI